MLFLIFDRRAFDLLVANAKLHFLSQFVEALEVEDAFADRFDDIVSFEDVGGGDLFCDGFEVEFAIEDERAIAVDIEGGFSLFWFDGSG